MRAIGPSTESVPNGVSEGPCATRPGLGRMPTTPQKPAGVRRLPPRSDPVASQIWPLASAAAEPPEEPPQVRLVSHGLRVSPNTSLKVFPPAPNSGVLDFASTTPPRSSSRSTIRSDRPGTWSAKIGEPWVERTPATSIRSLTASGRPASGVSVETRPACSSARSPQSGGKRVQGWIDALDPLERGLYQLAGS